MKYKVTSLCRHCGTKFSTIVSDVGRKKQIRCPNLDCNKVQREIGFDPGEGQAPGLIGSNIAKAIDFTAEKVMREHGMTDLKDNIREGDTMAPTLPKEQQKAVDTFFTPEKNPRLSNRGKRAIAGAFRSTALDVRGVLPDNRVALHKSGTEQLQRNK